METSGTTLPNDVEALKALVLSMARRVDEAEARLADARARESATEALIAHLKLQIARPGSVSDDVEIALGGVSGMGNMTRSGDEIKMH